MTTDHDCQTPVDPALLADYWLGLLPAPEEAPIEEHLFACDACGDRLREIIQLADALRALARAGTFRLIVPEAFITHAVETGRRVRQYDFVPGQTTACTISEDDEMLIGRLAADLSGVERVDLSIRDPQGVERQRMADIFVRRDAGRVILHESAVWAKLSPSTTMVAHLLSVGADGAERLLGEYTFQHTRTIPGPPGWEW